MKRKKVFFFLAVLYQGGEKVISELSFHLSEHIDATFVLFEDKVSYTFKGRLVDLGAPLSTNFFLRVWRFFVRLIRFRKLLKNENPDYVVSAGNGANAINILVNREKAIVRAEFYNSKALRGFWGFLARVSIRLLFNRAKIVVAVSRAIEEDLVQNFGISSEKIQVIFNGVDISKIERMSKKPLMAEYQDIFSRPVMITMGRLSPEKGHVHLLRAFQIVHTIIPTAQLVILGEGQLRKDLEKKAETLSLKEQIHFLGWQSNPFPFLAASMVFVLPSLWEALPIALLEAMACGLPVVSTDCGSGPREVLAPSTDLTPATDMEIAEFGILVPSQKEEVLAIALSRVLQDDQLAQKLRTSARKRIEDFRIEHIASQWDSLLTNPTKR